MTVELTKNRLERKNIFSFQAYSWEKIVFSSEGSE